MTAHATLSASSSNRWMNCSGSIREIAAISPSYRDTTSVYADEGTAAHALGVKCLEQGVAAEAYRGVKLGVERPSGNVLFYAPEFEGENLFEVGDDMIEAVQVYLDEVARVRAETPNADEGLEVALDVTWLRANMFGTADFVRQVPFGDLYVADYKHGAGVVVEVEWNSQAMYYALGALKLAGGPHDVENVHLGIIQPRARHADGSVRWWTISAAALWDWREQLAAAADRTLAPDAPLESGEWCRFCPARALCPELRKTAMEHTRAVFSDSPLNPDENLSAVPSKDHPKDVARALNVLPIIDAWIRAVEGLAQTMLEHGLTVPGYKLVRKRANRRWEDEAKTRKALGRRPGVKKADYVQEKLRSPAQLEKLSAIGKDFVGKHAVKPEGGLTVAHESDKRSAEKSPALAAFAESPASKLPAAVDGLDFLN